MCAKCKHEDGSCEKFVERKNSKYLVHGLLRCKTCNNVWNRDCNGATNIYKIAYNATHGKERPDYLCRNTNQPTRHEKGFYMKIQRYLWIYPEEDVWIYPEEDVINTDVTILRIFYCLSQ